MILRRFLLAPVLAIVGVAGWADQRAEAAACPPPDTAAEIRVSKETGRVRIDESLDSDGIAAVAGRRASALAASGRRLTGLTAAEFEVAYDIRVAYRRLRPGTVCVWLRRVEVRLGYPDTTIYVDRSYAPGSCAYTVVLDHENEHVTVNRVTFERALPALRRGLERSVRSAPFLVVGDEGAAKRAYAPIVDAALAPHLARLEAERERLHARLDSPENYAALQARCADW